MYTVNQHAPVMYPDGRMMILNEHFQWVQVVPAVQTPFQQLYPTQPQIVAQPQLAEESTFQEESVEAEEVPVTIVNPELTALPAKARESCPVVEEESILSKPAMHFLSSQDQEKDAANSSDQYPDSESGISVQSSIDFSDFVPLAKTVSSSSDNIQVTKYVVERKVQMRAGVTAKTANVCVLNPGQRVYVVKTQKSRTKAGFVTTKAYVITDQHQHQGWVSVNRQNKKTDEKFVFKGKVTVAQAKNVRYNHVWKRHSAKVTEVKNSGRNTFHVCVTCPSWQHMEALRTTLVSDRLVVSLAENRKATLVNKRIPQLVNMRRIFGNTPVAHVYDIDVDFENYHSKFVQSFDWSREYPGSSGNFESQVRKGLQKAQLEARRVTWNTHFEEREASLGMRDFCTVEFAKHSHLQNFLKNFEKYAFFKGAQAKIDPSYANSTTIPSHLVQDF